MIAVIAYLGLPELLAWPALLIAALLTWRGFTSVSSVRKTLRSIAVALGGFIGLHIVIAGTHHVSVAERSPDRRSVADLYETDWFVDRHFKVRVTTFCAAVHPDTPRGLHLA